MTERDPARPIYHYSSGNWMNDVIPYFDGERVHVYFDHNPRAAEWTRFSWGHASTTDLVTWRDEPVALSPTPGGADQEGCWTGCVVETPDGYLAAYTGISSWDPFTQVQCLATSTDLVDWAQQPEPAITEPPEGFGQCFRDPHVWREPDGTWRMLVGSTETATDHAAVVAYASPDLQEWKYAGPFYVADDDRLGNMGECPELFELGGRSVLVTSCVSTRAVVGEVDASGAFVASGPVTTFDEGESYAAKSFDFDGRRVQLAWVRDTREREERRGFGWSGALSLPRDLTMRPDGSIAIAPSPEVEQLRHRMIAGRTEEVSGVVHVPEVTTTEIEIVVDAPAQDTGTFIVRVGNLDIEVDWAAGTIAGRALGPFGEERLRLRVFVDRSIVEVFALDRVLTLRDYDLPNYPTLALQSEPGPSAVDLKIWELGRSTS